MSESYQEYIDRCTGPCAEQIVTCRILAEDGTEYVGQNWCLNPQEACPRESGEDYKKCTTICQQLGHAEQEALKLAGDEAQGAFALLEGHTYFCQECQHALFDAGVLYIGRAR